MNENRENNLFRIGDVGANGVIILQFWDFRKQEWNYFPARRTAPGEYITSSGKTGKFQEKPLTAEECKTYQEKLPAEKAAKYPWRDCKQSREYCAKLLAAGKDKEFIKDALTAMFPLTPAKTAEKTDIFAQLM